MQKNQPIPLKYGLTILDNYKIVKLLGKGSYSFVYLVKSKCKEKRHYVVKEFSPHHLVKREKNNKIFLKKSLTKWKIDEYYNLKKIFQYESENLKKLNRSNNTGLMKLISYHEDINNTSYIVTNYTKTIPLEEYLKTLSSPQELIEILKKLLLILEEIHTYNIYHQDIKLENVLIQEDKNPLLIDLGGSVILYDKISGSHLNTTSPDSASLEQLSLNYPPEITKSTDVYSVAALIYKILIGNYPTNAKIREISINKGDRDPYIPLTSKGLTCFNKTTLQKIDKALSLYQEERYESATEFINALEKQTIWQVICSYIKA